MISTDITRTVYRAALGTSAGAVCQAIAAGPATAAAFGAAPVQKSVDHRIMAELRASSFVGGHVWLRPAALDVLVPTTPGHLAWSPPT